MPPKKPHSEMVTESLNALPLVKSHEGIRSGLAGMMVAVSDGRLTAEEAGVLLKSTKKQSKKIRKTTA